MTSKVSNKKISPVLHNFWCGVRSKTKMAIIIGILHLVAAPAVVLAAIISVYSGSDVDGIGAFAVIGVITTAVAGFMGIIIAIDSFSCLHNKSVVDMRLSLPLTANQRFFSNYLSGLAVYIVPFLAAQVFSLLGMGYGLAFMDGRTFKREYWISGGLADMDYVCHYFSQFMPALLKLIFVGTLTMLMLYTLTVLVTVCCGSKFESIAYTILINIMIPLTIYLVFMSMFSNLFGVDIYDTVARLLMHTSPAGGIVTAAEWSTGEPFISLGNKNYAVWAVVYILLTAAMGAGAFLLYRKRRAEQVSKPFVFKALYYVITTLAIFCIYSAFYVSDGYDNIIAALLTTAIVYFILEVIANRGFRKIWLSGVKYIGAMAASVLIIFAAQKTEGFGMVTRVPKASSVNYVELNYSGFYSTFYLPFEYNEETGIQGRTLLTFKEAENIETVINAHQTAVDNRNDGRLHVTPGFEVTYHLKNGSTMKRQYTGLPSEESEIISRLDLTEEYKTQVAEIYSRRILKSVTDYQANEKYNPEYTAKQTVRFNRFNNQNDGSSIRMSELIKKNFFEQLAEAYSKDIMNITEESYYSSDLKNIYDLSGPSIDLTVPENFKNTMELIEYFGFRIVGKEDIIYSDVISFLEDAAKSERAFIYTADEWREINDISENVRVHSNYSYSRVGYRQIKNVDKDLYDLYVAAEPMNIVPDNGYIISVFGSAGVIPEELNGIAERVYTGRTDKTESEYDDLSNPFWSYSNDGVPTVEEIYTENYNG